jgi:hypothetical protein
VKPDSLYRALFDPASDHPARLDALKQVAIYTDCLGIRHWSKPWELASEELSTAMVKSAGLLARDKQHSHEEMELWVKYIGPARKVGSAAAVTTAFLQWEQDAIRRGWEAESPARQFMREALLSLQSSSTDDRDPM